MTTYTVTLRSPTRWAERTIQARTPATALATVRKALDADPLSFDWESYHHDGIEVLEEAVVADEHGTELLTWRSDEARQQQAAGDLLTALEEQTEAAQAVLDCWERGNLAGAVCRLDGMVSVARAAIARAKGGAP